MDEILHDLRVEHNNSCNRHSRSVLMSMGGKGRARKKRTENNNDRPGKCNAGNHPDDNSVRKCNRHFHTRAPRLFRGSSLLSDGCWSSEANNDASEEELNSSPLVFQGVIMGNNDSNGNIIVPFVGGTVKFLKQSSFVSPRDGRMVSMPDRVEIYGQTSKAIRLPKETLATLMTIIDERPDVREWMSSHV